MPNETKDPFAAYRVAPADETPAADPFAAYRVEKPAEEEEGGVLQGIGDSAADLADVYKARVSGGMMGLTSGHFEEGVAGLSSAAQFVTGEEVTYDKNLIEARAEQARLAEEHPITYNSADIGGGLVQGFLTSPIKAAKGVVGGFTGAVEASGRTDAEFGSDDYISDVAKGAALGSGIELVGGGVVKAGAKLAKHIPSIVEPIAAISKKAAAAVFGLNENVIDLMMKRPDVLNNVKSIEAIVASGPTVANKMKAEINKLSKVARKHLSKENQVDLSHLQDEFDEFRKIKKFTKVDEAGEVVPVGDAFPRINDANKASDRVFKDLGERNWSEKSIHDVIDNLDDSIFAATLKDETPKMEALHFLRTRLDSALKTNNKEFANAMVPVAKKATILEEAVGLLKLRLSKTDSNKFVVGNKDISTTAINRFRKDALKGHKRSLPEGRKKLEEFNPAIGDDLDALQADHLVDLPGGMSGRRAVAGAGVGAAVGSPVGLSIPLAGLFGGAGFIIDVYGRKITAPMIEKMAKRLKMPPGRVFQYVKKHGFPTKAITQGTITTGAVGVDKATDE